MHKFIIIILISLFLVSDHLSDAAERPYRFNKSEDVVAWLYRDYGWEALISNYFDKDSLIDQPASILTRYFTPTLAALITKDREATIKTKELGRINFMIIFGSQDPDGISNIRINKKTGTNTVSVLYDYNGEKDVIEIDFDTVKTEDGWRISDIHYKSRKSNAIPGSIFMFSLLELLSKQ